MAQLKRLEHELDMADRWETPACEECGEIVTGRKHVWSHEQADGSHWTIGPLCSPCLADLQDALTPKVA